MALTRNVIFIAFVLLVLVSITTQKKKKRQTTGPWWQCDDLVPVEKRVKIPWNPDSQNITVSTDSEAGSKGEVFMGFYDNGDYTGYVAIKFNKKIEYKIGYCNTFTPFPATLPTETEKTWTITYNYTELRLVLHCNGVLVADVLLSSACDIRWWRNYWGKKPTAIWFFFWDNASDTYCFSSNPGPWWQCDDLVTVERDVNIPWNPDNQTITVNTDSDWELEVGRWEKAVVAFNDAAGGPAGYVVINYKGCHIGNCDKGYTFTPFPATLPTETEKTWTITYNFTDKRLVLHCNGVQVRNVLLSSACDKSSWITGSTYMSWGDYWGKKPTQINFISWETASDTYCFSSNPVIDGVWKEWTEGSACSVTCGGGNKTSSRKCIKPQNGGNPCKGDAEKIESCGKMPCPGPLKLCDDLVPVELDVMIPWNPDSQTITVTTDSEAGSKEEVSVDFFDTDETYAGYVFINFKTEMGYYIGYCNKYYTPFSATLPIETEKTWTITYNFTEQIVLFHCNGVLVAFVVLSNSVCAISDWAYYWGKKPTQIMLSSSYDTASDTYCVSSNRGPWKLCDDLVTVNKSVYIPWNPDNQTITISTYIDAGSREEVEVYFLDTDKTYAGYVTIGNADMILRLGVCGLTSRFTGALPTETEKTWTITYNYTKQRLVLHCNGVQVLNVLLSSVCDRSDWRTYWGKKPTQIKFSSYDSASDKYCFSSNPGAI